MAKKKYWLGPGILSNPKGKPVQPDEEIPGPLLKIMGTERIKQLENQSKIADQPKSAALKETVDAKKENEKLIDQIVDLKIENEKLKSENKTLKNAEKDRDKAEKKCEKIQANLETLKKGYEALTQQLKDAKKGGGEGD